MDTLRQNLKISLKLLMKERGFTVTALLTLALCIGANSAIFSVVNTLMLRPLPYEEPDRLVIVFNLYPRAQATRLGCAVPDYLPDRLVIVFNLYPRAQATRLGCAVPDYFARREQVEAFEEVAV